ncbi:MAG: antibiotic biosynthesis monooxygenase [Planctomycetota bacterium]
MILSRRVTGLSGALVAFLTLTWLSSGCAISMPFRGPGYTAGGGATLAADDGTVVVALTQGVLDRGKRGPFDRATSTVSKGMADVPGLIGYSFRRQLLGKRVWTMTVWQDETALAAFVRSPLHREAMRADGPATEEFLFHSFRVPADDLPIKWNDALERLERDGTPYPDLGAPVADRAKSARSAQVGD